MKFGQLIEYNVKNNWVFLFVRLFNWDSLYARLNNH